MSQSVLRFFLKWQSSILRVRGTLGGDDGNAFIELALLVSLFGAPLLLGTSQVGLMMYDSIEVANAAHAGAMYGMMSSTFAADAAGIRAASKNEAPDIGGNLTVTPTTFYACASAVGGTQYTTQALANAACTGGSNHSLQFIQVVTSASVTSPIQFAGLPSTVTFGGTSVMEVEE